MTHGVSIVGDRNSGSKANSERFFLGEDDRLMSAGSLLETPALDSLNKENPLWF